MKPTAFVTGASYGIGAASALALARAGFDIAVSATHTENLKDVIAKLEATEARVFPVILDLRSQSSIEHAVDQTISTFGHLDTLVNNAGADLRKLAVEVTRPDWDGVIETNLTGPFFLTQQVGRHLIASGRPGSIVSIASTHGLIGTAERSIYGISKAAIIQMRRMLAVEWGRYGIRVNAIAPGRTDAASSSRAARHAPPGYIEAMLDQTPLHRLATAEEVAAAVCYLASLQASTITGQIVVIDGGLTVA
jgi:NAD(P)-dependent dehydrogenase (short-subunit alcohol dehydrogenase family)